MILFLLTTGLSLTYGLMGIVNLSHGAIYMLGAYVGWTVAVQAGLNWWLAVICGGVAAGLVGLMIERGFLRSLYKRMNEQVMLTIGFIYVIVNVTQWIWGGLERAPYSPKIFSGSFGLLGMQYPIYRMAVLGIGVVVAVGLWWFQERTRYGAIVRAGMDDQETGMGLGINMARVTYLVFLLGSFLAGIAGVIGAQMLGADLGMGWDILLPALIVLVVGGAGSIEGVLVGAMLIGLVDSFGRTYVPSLAMFFSYIVMVIILSVRPGGLIPRRSGGL